MPRINSLDWSVWQGITAIRLNDFNEDLDTLFASGSDRLRVYRISTDPALQVRIWSGTYRVWSAEWQFAGWSLTVTNNATNYIMINNAWAIVISTSGWNGQYARLWTVVASGGAITSITLWRNDVVGGELSIPWFSNITSTTYTNKRLVAFTADGINFTVTYKGYRISTITNGVNTWTMTYAKWLLVSTSKT